MANKLRVNLMRCGARQASRVIYPLGIPLSAGEMDYRRPSKKINGNKKPKRNRRKGKKWKGEKGEMRNLEGDDSDGLTDGIKVHVQKREFCCHCQENSWQDVPIISTQCMWSYRHSLHLYTKQNCDCDSSLNQNPILSELVFADMRKWHLSLVWAHSADVMA